MHILAQTGTVPFAARTGTKLIPHQVNVALQPYYFHHSTSNSTLGFPRLVWAEKLVPTYTEDDLRTKRNVFLTVIKFGALFYLGQEIGSVFLTGPTFLQWLERKEYAN